MFSKAHDEVDFLLDRASFVRSPVDVEDRDWSCQSPGSESISPNKGVVDEVRGCSTVDECGRGDFILVVQFLQLCFDGEGTRQVHCPDIELAIGRGHYRILGIRCIIVALGTTGFDFENTKTVRPTLLWSSLVLMKLELLQVEDLLK